MTSSPAQLGFDALLTSANQANRQRQVLRDNAHLPSTMAQALPFYRGLIERHHTAMLAADEAEAIRFKDEAHTLAVRLNAGNPGILAHEDAPGCILERGAAAPAGLVPLWGQRGDFRITVGSMRVRIEIDGLFGICRFQVWPGLSAHAVDYDRPFLSETGYRSFLGIHAELVANLTPESFAREVIASYVARQLKHRLTAIRNECRNRVDAQTGLLPGGATETT